MLISRNAILRVRFPSTFDWNDSVATSLLWKGFAVQFPVVQIVTLLFPYK